jgi:hypothetical protein
MKLEEKQFWTGVFTLLFIAIVMGLLCGCSHPASPISVVSSVDRLSAIQSNLSAVDGKAVVIEEYLKSH